MAEQTAFPLPRLAARGRADFLVAPANAHAVARIENWRGWPGGRLVLTGPEGAGKSHLAAVWADAAGARIIAAAALPDADLPALAARPLAVEDADRIAGERAAETALLHLFNLMAEAGSPLLVTARRPPAHWGLTLPDLESRLTAAPLATLGPPDDALLAALLVKLFAERQIAPPPRLIAFCAARMPRSFAAAEALVAALDAAALASGRPIGPRLAREVLDKLGGEDA
jgi:chromosomal replication initiation ATPase DnaA